MSAWELWLWLHEAMQGIPPWVGDERDCGARRYIAIGSPMIHNFDESSLCEGGHDNCFDAFVGLLGGKSQAHNERINARVPPAALALLERARAAWNERVYGDERDADGL